MSAEQASQIATHPASLALPDASAGRAALLETGQRPPRSPWQLVLARLRRVKLAMAGLVVLLVLVLVALFAPVLAPADPEATDLFNIKAPPSRENWLGTDDLGRDVLSRLIYGGRI